MVIVGAGVVGTAIARTLARYSLDCVLVDEACDVGTGTSKANTAILHTGFDAKPGSLESRLLRRGSALLREYAAAAGIPVERTGALLVAWTPEQAAALPGIEENARRNGYQAVRPLRAGELYAREPRWARGRSAALEIPDESIICPWTTPLAFATEAVGAGVRLLLGAAVTGVASAARFLSARHDARAGAGPVGGQRGRAGQRHDGPDVRRRRVHHPAAAGRAHRVRQAGPAAAPLDPAAGADGADQGGARRAHGLRERAARADRRGRARPRDTATTAAGLRSLLAAGRRILPGLADEEVTSTYAGLRAATEHADYQIYVDAERRYACAGGIRSTGLSASLGIAEHVVGLLAEAGLALKPRPGAAARRR